MSAGILHAARLVVVDPAHAVFVHPDFHGVGLALLIRTVCDFVRVIGSMLDHVDAAHAVIAGAFARHRIQTDMACDVVDVLLLLHELVVDIVDIGSDFGDIGFIVPAARIGAGGDIDDARRVAGSQIAVLSRRRAVQIHLDLSDVALVLGNPTVECRDVVRVHRDRTGFILRP